MKFKATVIGIVTVLAAAIPGSAAHASSGVLGLKLVNANSGKCLVVVANGSNGSNATQYTCLDYNDQTWYWDPTTGEMRNGHTDQCLTAQGTSNGAQAFDYACTGLIDQKWYNVSIDQDHFWIVNKNSNKCLVVQGTADGNRAFQYTCDYFYDQYWTSWAARV
ncbi:RICIN domain-containing protein [Kitasatospora sp. NPDC096140]|uniref:RICIN domain-containing protein n=1 Tax=Kitasatospora sp. NPDC096140 TaxID=3155425 RepID=UPI0033289E5A